MQPNTEVDSPEDLHKQRKRIDVTARMNEKRLFTHNSKSRGVRAHCGASNGFNTPLPSTCLQLIWIQTTFQLNYSTVSSFLIFGLDLLLTESEASLTKTQ
jgi:hypothetical protein